MVSGAADNTLRLWSVQTGKNLFTWEFPTAVKRVSFNDDGSQVVCITEQRMGYQSAVRVFQIDREGDGTNRGFCFCASNVGQFRSLTHGTFIQSRRSRCIFSTPSDQRQLCAHSPMYRISFLPVTNLARYPCST